MASRVEGVAGIQRALRARPPAAKAAGKSAVGQTTRAIQLKIRARVSALFPRNARAGNAIRSKLYDNKDRGNAGIVYSRFGRGRGANFVDFLTPYLTGRDILPKAGRYLAIPLQKGRRNRDPRAVQGLRVATIAGRLYLVKGTRTRTLFYFLLVPRVRISKRLTVSDVASTERQGLTNRIRAAYRPAA